MKFSEFWHLLTREFATPKTLYTIKQSKEFEAHYSGGTIIVTPGTRYRRSIRKSEFEKVWSVFKKNLDPYRPILYQRDTYHASYILAIIKYFLKNGKVE